MGRRLKLKGTPDMQELRRSKYLDLKTIGHYAVTPAILRAPFPQGSAELRAAADRALAAELELAVQAASIKGPKK